MIVLYPRLMKAGALVADLPPFIRPDQDHSCDPS